MACPTVDQLQALLTEALPEGDVERLESHVDSCASCRTTLDDMSREDDLLDDMRALLGAEPPPAQPTTPERIAQYRILDVIGEGGMGVVYRAEQERPHRQVALKVMHPATISRRSMRRFELEVEVLGQLDHAGIARIYEAGTAHVFSADQPFFAMELVEGQRLDRYVEREVLDRDARLRLFLEICDAVQYAHLRGVIHRDLKPGNILVDGEGRPKVIDFGLARATASGEEAHSLPTEKGGVLGTLPYMAPEQVDGDPDAVDTRADVYGLGAVLYELLCGRPPLRLENDPLPRAARRITEEAPPRPSSLRRDLPRELDWVLGRALAKRPEERYEAVSALAADLRRLLADEPLEAGPPGALYRARLFVRRHRLAVVAAGLALAALATGAGFTIHGLVETARAGRIEARAHAATRAAETEARTAEAEAREAEAVAVHNAAEMTRVADFVLAMFEQRPEESDYLTDRGQVGLLTMEDLLLRVTSRIEEEFPDLPRHRAHLYNSIGMAWFALGDHDEARRCMQQALDLRIELFGRLHEETLESINDLGLLALNVYDMDTAERLLEEAVAGREQLLQEDDVDLMRSVAFLAQLHAERSQLRDTGYERAEALLRRHLELGEIIFDGDHPELANSLQALGTNIRAQGRFAEATALLREALVMCWRHLPDRSVPTAVMNLELGSALWQLGQRDEALCHYEHSLAILDEVTTPEDPYAIHVRSQLATALGEEGHDQASFEMMRDAYAAAQRVSEGTDLRLDGTRRLLRNQVMQARDRLLNPLRTRLLTVASKNGEDAEGAVALRRQMLELSLDAGVHDSAHIELLAACLESHNRRLGLAHPASLEILAHHAHMFGEQGDEDRRQGVLTLIEHNALPCLDAAGPRDAFALADLARLLDDYGESRLALPFARTAVELGEDELAPTLLTRLAADAP